MALPPDQIPAVAGLLRQLAEDGPLLKAMAAPSGTSALYRRFAEHHDADRLLLMPRRPGRATFEQLMACTTLPGFLEAVTAGAAAYTLPQPPDLGVVQLAGGFTIYELRDWFDPPDSWYYSGPRAESYCFPLTPGSLTPCTRAVRAAFPTS